MVNREWQLLQRAGQKQICYERSEFQFCGGGVEADGGMEPGAERVV
ncbi:MAG TPA: hypothetical protein VIM16_10115 [Mucilaginibacter sp.]